MLTYLHTIRSQKGYSLQQLSNKSHVSKTVLHNIETRKVIPKADQICKLAKALQMSPSELFDRLIENEPWEK